MGKNNVFHFFFFQNKSGIKKKNQTEPHSGIIFKEKGQSEKKKINFKKYI